MMVASPLTLAERQKWTNDFGSHLDERLRWLIAYVSEHRQKPAYLKPYGDSLITLIKQAWFYPSLAQPVVNLTLALHPLPERWGYWTAWDEVLQAGAAIAASHAWHAPQAELLAHRAHLLWSCSRYDEAMPVGRLALQIAETAGAVLSLGPDHVFTQIGVFFGKAAVVTFGGAYAVLAYISQEAVSTYGWLQPGEMLDGLGMAETTPGPLIQVVQFVGFMGAYRNPGALSPMIAVAAFIALFRYRASMLATLAGAAGLLYHLLFVG